MPRDLEEFLRKAAQRRQQHPGGGSPDSAAEPSSLRRKSPQVNTSVAESSLESSPSPPSKVHLADERMDAQLHEHFDHGLGGLAEPTHSVTASDSPDTEMDRSNVLGDLILMLGQPRGVQQAILLNDILNRPTHRWD